MTVNISMVKGSVGLVFCGALLMVAVWYWQKSKPTRVTEVCDLSFTGNIHLYGIPVAGTKAQQEKGLYNRDDVGPGMLFAFDPPGNLAFSMRGTRIPLSISFVSEDGTLFAVEDMTPESNEYHLSMKPAKYALELPQGQFQSKGLAAGSRLLKEECRPVDSTPIV